MPNYIIFNPTSVPVANRVTGYLSSVSEATVAGRADVIQFQDPLPTDHPLTDYVVDSGTIREMDSTELDTIADYLVEQHLADEKYFLEARRLYQLSSRTPTNVLNTKGINPFII